MLSESRRLVRAGESNEIRIPPEPRAQRWNLKKNHLVSGAGTPPLSGRVLLDMSEWVV